MILGNANNKKYLYDNVVVEIDYYDNCYPYANSIDTFKEKIDSSNICKKQSILVIKGDSLGPKDYRSVTLEELYVISYAKRNIYNESYQQKALFVHFLCLRGAFEAKAGPENKHNVIGLTYNYNSVALFYPTVRVAEGNVMLHELVHVILKDDPNQHCSNTNCIMAPIVMSYTSNLDIHCQGKINQLIDQTR